MQFQSFQFTIAAGDRAKARLQSASNNSPPFRFGESSDAVKNLQRALLQLDDPRIKIPSGATGNYFAETRAAVMAFQQINHLAIDGEVGPDTLSALDVQLSTPGVRPLPAPFPPFDPSKGSVIQVGEPKQPTTISLFTTDFEFVDIQDATLTIAPARLTSGRFKVRNSEDEIGLDFVGAGIGAGKGPQIGDGNTLFFNFISGNLSNFLKLVANISGFASAKIGTILKNPANVSGDLLVRHLTEGLTLIWKGDLGAAIGGVSGSLVFFGVPFTFLALLGNVALAVPATIVSLLVEGRFPAPNAVGLLGKASVGQVGATASLTIVRITGASILSQGEIIRPSNLDQQEVLPGG